MEIYKWKWIFLNEDFEKKIANDKIVLDVFIICQKLVHIAAMT